MIRKSPKSVIAFIIGAMVLLTAFAYAQNPPQAVEEHNCEEHQEESQVLNGILQEIDLSQAKVIKIKPNELTDTNCANEIANSLVGLGAIGELTVDIAQGIVTVQYDASKTDENKILEAFATTQHDAVII